MPYNYDTNEMEFTDLEQKFDAIVKVAQPLIDEQLEIAKQAVKRACEISEQHGVPFSGYLLGAGNQYVPKSFDKKFSEIEDFEHWDLPSGRGYPGWQSSYC